MQPTRAWALLSGAVFWSSALLICCGTDEAIWPNDTPRGDLIGGEGNSNDAGRGSGAESSGGQPTAGSGGALTLGGSSGTTNTPGGGANEAGAMSEGGTATITPGGEGGGGAGPLEEQLGFCARLDAQVGRVNAANMAYTKKAYSDCDTYWIMRDLVDRMKDLDFKNGLTTWSYNLWGCEGASPVSRFGLVWENPAISAGDAQRLIDIYVAAVDEQADLSSGEEAELRAALARLSKLVVVDESLEPSHPNSNPKCQGEGGAGGGATEPPGTAGHGGEP